MASLSCVVLTRFPSVPHQDYKRVLVYGGEDEFVDEDMRTSCGQLKVVPTSFRVIALATQYTASTVTYRDALHTFLR